MAEKNEKSPESTRPAPSRQASPVIGPPSRRVDLRLTADELRRVDRGWVRRAIAIREAQDAAEAEKRRRLGEQVDALAPEEFREQAKTSILRALVEGARRTAERQGAL